MFRYSKKRFLNLYILATTDREVFVTCPDAKSYVFYRRASQTLTCIQIIWRICLNADSDGVIWDWSRLYISLHPSNADVVGPQHADPTLRNRSGRVPQDHCHPNVCSTHSEANNFIDTNLLKENLKHLRLTHSILFNYQLAAYHHGHTTMNILQSILNYWSYTGFLKNGQLSYK